MTKSMLIDALHPEETRVVIADENQIYDFDFVSTAKKQLKGNIYLAKITRVEPSLQAAFVEYGGGKQGFLPFAEIHPDYYQIPTADRQRLMEEVEREAAAEEARQQAATPNLTANSRSWKIHRRAIFLTAAGYSAQKRMEPAAQRWQSAAEGDAPSSIT